MSTNMSNNKVNFHRTQGGKLFINTPEYQEMKANVEANENTYEKYTNFYGKHETNEEFLQRLAIISAASIMSDTIHREEEMIICQEICKELNLDWEKFSKILDDEINKIGKSDFPTVEKYLTNRLDKEDTTNAMVLFEAAIHIILADGMMTDRECKLLADISNLLKIPTSKIIARIGLFIKQEKEVLIDKPDNFDWLYGADTSDFYY